MNVPSTFQQPFFLVASERSGTTLLRLMLNGHPKLAWHEEFEFVVDYMPADAGLPPIERYHRDLAYDFIFASSKFEVDPKLSYPELVNSFLTQKAARGGKPIVGATIHRYFDRLLRIWPDAKFVHIVRDPRDVATSMVKMGWAGNVWRGCLFWEEAEQEWDKLCGLVPESRRITISFEELITSPTQTLSRICEFCGVSFDPAMLDYPRTSTYGPPDASAVATWKRKMSVADVRTVEAAVGPLLTRRGYVLSGYAPLTLTASRRAWLKAGDNWGRLRFRISRFGVSLVFQDMVSRRTKMKSWQERVRLRLNDIERLYVK